MSLAITFHRAAITSDLALLLSSWLAEDTTARPDPKPLYLKRAVRHFSVTGVIFAHESI
jgi:hypothetical protein